MMLFTLCQNLPPVALYKLVRLEGTKEGEYGGQITPNSHKVVCSRKRGCGENIDKPNLAHSAGLPPPLPPDGSGTSLGAGGPEGIKVGVLVGVAVGVLVGGGVKLPSLIDFGGIWAKTRAFEINKILRKIIIMGRTFDI
ncbi:hypothetical protein A2781_07375 [Candidatus Gottesmanbacteria bacterium RIFCSPHIGHO2_01_FULL_42_27]|uniref:Uncharacterized protein n=1 Tax=Candidatus Gottesmanbacteria bacterium RIFCSPLOWO2_01_FULL_42_22 TaxID=1798391 RepID=A0A1F6BK31_9BACT|nr:MAG: hypothetical protein A2781_07375 [Candidatus Gottesmanbacteria bacterium RIFCSPHIGHO2_01_FULL_42_27]OGG20137.1 MAG: hypothetical protein A3E72_01100 [Candidatus Gottesmanbacteria bacterium RIFCSPHIGHO2_12_FULL_43_26]OGG33310.1 MAG: hypothetical protein A3G68_06645 [Candidatus Gottesmanbacteria bacterium RIFCSPLOWO2_12_FULL_42_10]OGG37213.1 MAG: hypothetical protein A2968_05260 [Candidatus Gottesmanbacteria bacterium RIFCSPLOWO2_01_FULL_42_22]